MDVEVQSGHDGAVATGDAMDEPRVLAAMPPPSTDSPPRDVLPALPLGTPVFHSLPGRALVLPALAPAVGDGIVVPRLGESAGVLLIRGGEIVECFCIDGGETITGDAALQRMTRWGDASVSATQLSVAEASLISQLFHGEPVYEDLRLGWVDWSGILADLRQRRGGFVVELTTPTGRGVTSIREGSHVVTYTDQHPGLGDPTMLDDLAEHKQGTIRVLRDDSEGTAPSWAESAEMAGPVVALDTPLPAQPPVETDSSSFTELFGTREEHTTSTAVEEPPVEDATLAPPPAAEDFTELLPDLKLLVRSRLQMSSPRVEILLEDAVASGRPLEWVADQVRVMAIRGVQEATLERLADDMIALAGQRAR